MSHFRPTTYHSRNPLAAASPLRSYPWGKPAYLVLRPVAVEQAPAMVSFVGPSTTAAAELAAAAAALREAEQCYATARRMLGEANRTRSADLVVAGRVVMPGRPYSADLIRQHKSQAMRWLNSRRALLRAARRRLDAAACAAAPKQ